MAQSRLLKDLLVLFIIGLVIYMSFRTYQVYNEVRSDEISQGVDSSGLDEELSTAVLAMEKELSERQTYTFSQKKDPMDATKMIQFDLSDLYDLAAIQALNKKMRLSCTVIDEDPSAIIKYMGQSHIVHIGESVNDKKVVEITPKSVKFDDGEILYNKPAPSLQDLLGG